MHDPAGPRLTAAAKTVHGRRVERSALSGRVVLSFESRRATEMAELIRRHGGKPLAAPSMREVPLENDGAASEFLRRLERGELDVVILLTGVGTRALVSALAAACPREHLASLLSTTALVARGPKPVAALRELGLRPRLTAPEPNTWRELLQVLDAELPLAGRRVALQEYGVTNAELVAEIEKRAASLLRVPVYRWALPEDTGPLRRAIESWAAGEVDAVLFTSGNQVFNVMSTAEEMGLAGALRAAPAWIASIGPVCSEALREHGLRVDIEPEHGKMGQLVAAVAAWGASRGPGGS